MAITAGILFLSSCASAPKKSSNIQPAVKDSKSVLIAKKKVNKARKDLAKAEKNLDNVKESLKKGLRQIQKSGIQEVLEEVGHPCGKDSKWEVFLGLESSL